jgi:hypothetical protein
MQFRVQARKLQFIRSVYNKETKRCDQKLVGSMSSESDKIPPDDQIEMLSDKERQELAAYLKTKAEKILAAIQSISAEHIGENLIFATNGILAGEPLSKQQVRATWDGLAKLTKALKTAGYPKPEKTKTSGQPTA